LKIAVTRTAETAGALADRLAAEGFDVVVCPLIRIEPIPGPALDPTGYDWVVVTSRVAARELARRLASLPARLAAIGPGTAEELRAAGLEPDLVARRSTQEGLVEDLRGAGRILFPGAEGAREVLARDLGAETVPLYRTVAVERDGFPDADLVLLASASAARALAALRRDLPCVTIGPLTTEAARAAGLQVVAEAERHDLDGLVRSVRAVAAPEL
jgi:uroporphyrinogen III methyltransferase/synthase